MQLTGVYLLWACTIAVVPLSRKRVLGVLAGGDLPPEQLAQWCHSADFVLAADGGADRCLASGVTPDLTVGDLDSLVAEGLPNVLRVQDQERSDCDKLLAQAAQMGAERVVLAGAEGDRLDHTLASLSSALASGLRVSFALRRGMADLVLPPGMSRSVEPDDIVSVMPLMPCQGFSIDGVRWPLSGVELLLGGQISLSNRAEGTPVRIRFASGAALLFRFAPRLESPIWDEN
jgi:thiamine pyrophosphokinase